MNRMLLMVAVMGMACGGGDDGAATAITVTDHADALTDNGGDKLATLTLTEAKDSYDVGTLEVIAKEAGQTGFSVNFDLVDGNGDGKLGKGESLTVKEPNTNVYGAAAVGKKYTITAFQRGTDNVLRQLGAGDWTAN